MKEIIQSQETLIIVILKDGYLKIIVLIIKQTKRKKI